MQLGILRLIMSKKRIVCLLFIGCAVALSSAQSISEIKGNKDYIWGEGKGVTLTEADKEALNDLITQISVTVESKYSKIDENVVAEEGVSTQSSFKAVLQTYSNATLQNTERFVLSNEPDAHVFRFVKKSDVDRIFASRKAKVNDMVAFALRAQKERKIDEALRNFYWAYCLLQSLPSSHEITYDNNGEACLLMTWIPEQIRKIFSSIKIMRQPASDDGYDDMIVLNITYAGEPISSFDYTYFDGRNWSNIYSAKDGLGVIELLPGMATDNIQVRCEYEFSGEAHTDKEIESVVKVMKGTAFRDAYIWVRATADSAVPVASSVTSLLASTENAVNNLTASAATAAEPVPVVTVVEGDEAAPYETVIGRVLDAVRTREYYAVQPLFTEQGWTMFEKLLAYGQARLLDTPHLNFIEADDKVICRSIPMSFSFKNNTRKFVEDVVFTFDADKKIESLAFGLGKEAMEDILYHSAWEEKSRIFLMSFLENYKTAYALKRLDYIRDIFDDNAVIITGTVTQRVTGDVEMNSYRNNHYVRYNRQTKNQYLRNLDRCFRSNEFINIRFGNNDVVKAGAGGELYGIQIKQDYYSTNYGDQGYLFLMVDLNDPDKPIIKVRTWQPEKDPDFGLYDIGMF